MFQTRRRALAPVLCAAALASGVSKSWALPLESQKFHIAFDFKVDPHKTMRSGDYQVRQAAGSEVVTLVNTKTGESAQFLRPDSTHVGGKTRLEFERDSEGMRLIRIR
jgi:hypothetical protein